MNDAFVHHPELRDEIAPPEQSMFWDFSVAKLEALSRKHGSTLDWWHSDEEREALRAAALKDRAAGDLWVFGYGSLMWDPGFRFAEVRRAQAPEYARRFIIRDIYGGRGNAENPGLMAALDDGDGCEGLAFRIEAANVEEETARLWAREQVGPAYVPRFIDVTFSDGPGVALTFVADHAAELIDGDITRDEQVRFLATGAGFLGTSLEYIRNLAEHFDALGVEDAEVSDLLKATLAYAEARSDV